MDFTVVRYNADGYARYDLQRRRQVLTPIGSGEDQGYGGRNPG